MARRTPRRVARARRRLDRSAANPADSVVCVRGSDGLRKSQASGDRNAMSLRVEQDGRLCRITLALPERRNLLDAEACGRLLREIEEAAASEQTGAILIEADGSVFCAGAEPESEDFFSFGQ